MKTGPSINKGKSRQDYATPWEFVESVERRFGKLSFDLAASADNRKAPKHFDISQDSLTQNWNKLNGVLWLNPPFGIIGPWAKKCAETMIGGGRILMLTPASVGSNWFAEHVHGKALVLFISPRLMFEGADDPYPKDLILSCFGFGCGYETWRYK